jgi:hypothetical protein
MNTVVNEKNDMNAGINPNPERSESQAFPAPVSDSELREWASVHQEWARANPDLLIPYMGMLQMARDKGFIRES